MSSIGIRNGLSMFARRLRNVLVDRLHQLVNLLFPLGFAVQCPQRRQLDHRHIVARELVRLQQLANFELHQVEQLGIIHRIALVQRNTTMYGTPTWRASSTCSRVCGIGPSVAATTRIAPSICAAPVIMFLM